MRGARFEDPVGLKDDVQYNIIVNDWFGRAAYYLRSRDKTGDKFIVALEAEKGFNPAKDVNAKTLRPSPAASRTG